MNNKHERIGHDLDICNSEIGFLWHKIKEYKKLLNE